MSSERWNTTVISPNVMLYIKQMTDLYHFLLFFEGGKICALEKKSTIGVKIID